MSRAGAARMLPSQPPRRHDSAARAAKVRGAPGARRGFGQGPGASGGAAGDGGEARARAAGRRRLFFFSKLLLPPPRIFGRLGEGPCRREAGAAGLRGERGAGRRGSVERDRPEPGRVRGGGRRPDGRGPGSRAAGGPGAGAAPAPQALGSPWEEVEVPGPRGPCVRRVGSRGSPSRSPHVAPGGPRRRSPGDPVSLPRRGWAPPGNSCEVPRQLSVVPRG